MTEPRRGLPSAISLHPARWGKALSSLAAVMLAITAGACDRLKLDDHAHPALTDPVKRHPITVVAEHAELDVPLQAGRYRPTALADLETVRFARRYMREGRGPLTIAVPEHVDSRHASFKAVRELQKVLAREGVTAASVRTYRKPLDRPQDSITLSFDRLAAIGPTCGDWSEDVTRNPRNLPYPNYGCASQRNLAHMIANPSDVVFAARETPRGSDRRDIPRRSFVETPPSPPTPAKGGAM